MPTKSDIERAVRELNEIEHLKAREVNQTGTNPPSPVANHVRAGRAGMIFAEHFFKAFMDSAAYWLAGFDCAGAILGDYHAASWHRDVNGGSAETTSNGLKE